MYYTHSSSEGCTSEERTPLTGTASISLDVQGSITEASEESPYRGPSLEESIKMHESGPKPFTPLTAERLDFLKSEAEKKPVSEPLAKRRSLGGARSSSVAPGQQYVRIDVSTISL